MKWSSNVGSIHRVVVVVWVLGCCISLRGAGNSWDHLPAAIDGGTIRLPIVDRQDIRFNHLSTADGVSKATMITALVEDGQGFIWFGTRYGLSRYDGYKFKLFTNEPGRPGSLSGVYVTALFKDRAGILWVGSDLSLDRFDPSTETFTNFRLDGDPSTAPSNVIHISQDRAGMIWLATEIGLRRLDPVTGKITSYHHAPNDTSSLSSSYVRMTGEDRAGRFWVLTREGLDQFDRVTGKVTWSIALPERLNSAFYEDSTGVFWIVYASGDGLATLDRATHRLTRYRYREGDTGIAQSGVRIMMEDRLGNLWFATERDGVLKLDRERRTFIRYRNDPENPNSLSFNAVQGVAQDREGNIWIRGQQGINIFPSTKPPFDMLWQEAGGASTTAGPNFKLVSSVIEDHEGIVWMGAGPQLIRLDRKTAKYSIYPSAPAVAALLEDGAGTLWVGTLGGGLMYFDRTAGRLQAFRDNPADVAIIYQLRLDRSGNPWVVTTNDIKRVDRENQRLIGYLPRSAGDALKGGGYLRASESIEIRPISFEEDQQGMLWVGTNNAGLYRLNPGTGQITKYLADPADIHSLSNGRVNSIYTDRAGRMWIATQNGLNQFDPKTSKFTAYFERDGLAGNAVNCVLEDGGGALWMSTNKGISRFDPGTKTFKNYSLADGLPATDLTGYPACYKSPKGEMFFAGFGGATAFHPEEVVRGSYEPPILLTDFRLFGKQVLAMPGSVLEKSITRATALKVPYDQNSFSLEFAALSYLNAAGTRYRYRLEGLDAQWNEVDSNERLVTYPSTPPGDYTFRVQAASARGGWNEPGTQLRIQILPPWWETWWFRSLAGLSIAAAVVGAYKTRVRGLKLAAIRLETQVRERTHELAVAKEAAERAKDEAERANKAKSAFLATMSHELRTPLNSILGFSALVRDDAKLAEGHRTNLEIVNRSGEYLLSLIDDVLDTAKIEAGRTTVEKRDFDLIQLVRENIEMMRVRAADRGIELILACAPSTPRVIRSDPGKIRQILINLMSNAVKFTERGSVTVQLAGMDPLVGGARLLLEVEDTGIGIALEDQAHIFDLFVQAGNISAQKGTGLGLSITQQFVHLMGGTISVESMVGKGSRFRVDLPVERATGTEIVAAADQREVIGLEPGQPSYRVLIVEDRKENWMLPQKLLLDVGFQVEVAEDGAQGVEKFRTWQPDLIWMDVRLPVLGGVEAAEKIRLLEEHRRVKIVALSASAFAHEREAVLAAGMDDFLRKPYRRQEIFDVMSRHLGVRYVYQQADQASPPIRENGRDLSKLPWQLRKDLKDAVITLDAAIIREVIDRVRQYDAQLGEMLDGKAKRSKYSEILKALET